MFHQMEADERRGAMQNTLIRPSSHYSKLVDMDYMQYNSAAHHKQQVFVMCCLYAHFSFCRVFQDILSTYPQKIVSIDAQIGYID